MFGDFQNVKVFFKNTINFLCDTLLAERTISTQVKNNNKKVSSKDKLQRSLCTSCKITDGPPETC